MENGKQVCHTELTVIEEKSSEKESESSEQETIVKELVQVRPKSS